MALCIKPYSQSTHPVQRVLHVHPARVVCGVRDVSVAGSNLRDASELKDVHNFADKNISNCLIHASF